LSLRARERGSRARNSQSLRMDILLRDDPE
jgi:hypothetical protein